MIWLDEGGHDRDARLIAPPERLRDAVDHFWILGVRPRGLWRIVPDTSAHLIFSITKTIGGLSAHCHVVGARTTYYDAEVADRMVVIGARFRPGVLARLVRDDADRLTDRSVEIDSIFGNAGARLVEEMAGLRSDAAVGKLAAFLASSIRASEVRHAVQPVNATSVRELASAMGLSRRSVYDRFRSDIGLSPKRALRIRRLHRALAAMNRGLTLAQAAAESGYSDQAHFTREAVHLLGESPAVWRRRGCSSVQDRV